MKFTKTEFKKIIVFEFLKNNTFKKFDVKVRKPKTY